MNGYFYLIIDEFALSSIIFVFLMAFLLFLVFGGFGFLVFRLIHKKQQRNSAMRAFAEQTGFNFIGRVPPRSIESAAHFYLFNLGKNPETNLVMNFMTGTANDFQISIFDYLYPDGIRRQVRGQVRKQTVVMLESARLNLPLFSMKPESRSDSQRLAAMFDNQNINFASNPDFSGKYLLNGSYEQQIRQLFDDRTLAFFASYPAISLEGSGNCLIAYRAEVAVEAAQLQAAIDEGMNVANLFSNR